MATESMIIKIGADLGPAIAETGKLSNALDDVSKSVRGAASSFAQIAPPLSTVSKSVERITPSARGASAELDRFRNASKGAADAQKILPPTLDKTAKALNKITPGANAAGFALTNVGRVAQDLPFGFLGIQNNLNPLLESFQRLKAETGSSKAAFKALGSSLIGAGGIGLALSLVSSAILIFQNGIGGFGKKAKEAKEAADELAKSIRSIGAVEGEGAASVAGQIAQVSALAGAVSDSNRPYEERKRALDELKDINKSYFNDLKIEDAATGKLTTTVQEYVKALTNSAIQKQFVDEIAKVAKAQVDADVEITKSTDKVTRARQKVIEFTKLDNATQRVGVTTNNASANARRELAKAEEELAKANDKSTQLQEQKLVIEDRLNKTVAAGLKLKDLDTKGDKKEEDALKKRIDALKSLESLTGLTEGQQIELAQLEIQLASRDAVKLGFTQSELQQQIEGILETAFPVKTFAFNLEAQPDLKLLPAKIPTNLDIPKALNLDQIPLDFAGPIIDKMQVIGEKMKQLKLEEQAKAQAEAIAGVLTPAFEGLFTAILDGQNAFDAVGDAIRRLISDMVKAVIRAAALAAIFSLIFPASKGGSSFFGAFKNLLGGGFADGGVATGPKSGYLALLHGTELIIPMNKIGKTNSTGVQGAAFDQPIILQPSVAIQGQALRILLNRVDATNGRLF